MKKIVVMMLLCMGLCFAACGKKEEEKAEKKSDFVVEINGKEYDLTGKYMTLLNEFMDDEILTVDHRLKEYNKDGSVDEENGWKYLEDPSYFENPLYVSMRESLEINDMIILNEYRLPTDVEGLGFQNLIQEILNTDNRDNIDKYWLLEDEIIGIYVDGELVDINPYIELVKKEKEENNVLREITQKYVYDYEELGWVYAGVDTKLHTYEREHKEELTEREILRLDVLSNNITISEISDLIPDFDNCLAVSIACQEAYRKLLNDEIEWCGMIRFTESDSSIYFSYYDNDEEEVNEKIERNGW